MAAILGAAALHSAAKSYKSAACIVPPRQAWSAIQEVRVFNDKSFARWPPHVNLLYPFVEAQHFEQAAAACQQALRATADFQVTLAELGHFEHGRSCTLWLRPDAAELLAVQAALHAAFPQCSDLSDDPTRGIAAFTPHLSLGQWRTRAEVLAAQQHLAASWQAVSFTAGGVALLSREGFDDPFSLRWFVPFGGGPPVEAGGAPYICTVGQPCSSAAARDSQASGGSGSSTAPSLTDRFGVGSARPDGTVWQFAYGANMCPAKLNGARGLQPLESLPARLPGWRLCFNHRGGMGNLERLAPGQAGPAGGLDAVHGVLHRLSAADYARLANMEHEYRPLELDVFPYGSSAPVPAVAFVTPEDRCIADGLPPIQRYLQLLQEGARHWQLDPAYTQWLTAMQSIDSKQRGEAYYTTTAGAPLAALPKIRTGSQPQRQQRHRRPRGEKRGQQA